ncbi:MAG: exodeoxyribonuclease V subunit gamma, partial [Victivallales bacterium]|nr:exodeoxyribonuclease V subunit gamma [Victivallales bacterium]
FLLEKKIPQIMMDLEFVRLPEFVNDWLGATVRLESPRERHANQHPYSKSILTWRIYRLLEKAAPDGELQALLNYVNGATEKRATKRYSLSAKLACLYDDYLNSRFKMLRKWEQDSSCHAPVFKVPEWQIALYRELVQENQNSYAKEFEDALSPATDAKKAFEVGFPRYPAVFVFDIPFIPEPMLRLLEKISEAMPMTFWNFNPKDDWLAETPSQKEVARRLREKIQNDLKKHRVALELAQPPGELSIDIGRFYDSPEERLLGAMASGARGILGALCDDCMGDVETPTEGRDPLEAMGNMQISVHRTYSPRRELEAIKDGLHDFLKDERNAPHEALVLCANWETYAPFVDAVFPSMPENAGYIPITMGGIAGSTPLMQSFVKLLEFRKNRFEASAVFKLLDIPAIRTKYGLDENAVDALCDMSRKANIHWGLNDDDVAHILKLDKADGPYPFTWQRGLDRLTAELLYGFPENEELLLTVGDLPGQLHPIGHVEGERAKSVAALWSLVGDLARIRGEFSQGNKATPETTRERLLEIINTFYVESNDNSLELNRIRTAIHSVAENMLAAGLKDAEIEGEVFIQAMQEAINSQMPGRRTPADAVQFAPLNAYTATPHKFVWICGLNDGVFPRVDRQASFDAIGRHPSLFDATAREKDAFALLKAALCAEKFLSFSFVGKEMRSNEDIPSSVLLTNLTDYFKARQIAFTTYNHPLQGYSHRYFIETSQMEAQLPPSYSRTYEEMAKSLDEARKAPANPATASSLVAFPLKVDGVTEIALDDFVEFFAHPNRFLLEKRLKAKTPWTSELNDDECLMATLDKALQKRLALEKVPVNQPPAQLVVEMGNAPDEDSAENAIVNAQNHYERVIEFTQGKGKSKTILYACMGDDGNPLNLAKTYNASLEQPTEDFVLELPMSAGGTVRLKGSYGTIRLQTGDGNSKPHVFFWADGIYDSTLVEIKIRHLVFNAVRDGDITTIAFSPDTMRCCLPLDKNVAEKLLGSLLELATGPTPVEYPDLEKTMPKDDILPKEWLAPLDGIQII